MTVFATRTKTNHSKRPMFMIFIVNDRNVDVYRRIKKSCDVRFGVPSQVLQSKASFFLTATFY
jgi:eukaryotic translation initiation factor 2C